MPIVAGMALHLDRTDLAWQHLGCAAPGDGSAGVPTLVLLHGMGDSGSCWPDAVARWGHHYRLIAVDARGHGRSPRFSAVELDEGAGAVMVADTVTLLEDLAASGVAPPVLVAHSMGAAVAAIAALEVPDLVRALVLEDPAWRHGLSRWARQRRSHDRVADADLVTSDVAQEVLRGRAANPTWPEVELEPWAVSTTQADVAFLALEQPLPTMAWTHVARSLSVPTLLVTGTDDVIVNSDIRLALGDLANPLLEITVVNGAGHCVRRDRPQGYHRVVDPWIAGRWVDADSGAGAPGSGRATAGSRSS